MSEKIRVAMLGSYPADTSRIWGGVQAAYAYLVKGLSQISALDIHILTNKPTGYAGPDNVRDGNLTIHFLNPYPRFERLRNYKNYQTTVYKKLVQIQPDLVHAQDAGAESLVAMGTGFPTVTTVHGIRWEDGKHYTSIPKLLRNYFDSFVTERYVMRNARHLIAISHYVTDYFKDVLRPDVDVHYIPNAIDERFFNLSQRPDEQIILFAGRVIPRKRVMDLVHAFARVHRGMPNARLHIAGETTTEPNYAQAIRRWVHEAHLDDHVRWLGPLSEEAILHEFSGCSILALPSAQETAPMVIAQAMAAQKPVVATRVGGVEEMVAMDGACGFLVNVGDIEGFADAMLLLLQEPAMQVDFGMCGRAFAQENYHLENVARRTYDVYRKIAFPEELFHA